MTSDHYLAAFLARRAVKNAHEDDVEFQQQYSDFIREKYGIAQPFAEEDSK